MYDKIHFCKMGRKFCFHPIFCILYDKYAGRYVSTAPLQEASIPNSGVREKPTNFCVSFCVFFASGTIFLLRTALSMCYNTLVLYESEMLISAIFRKETNLRL